MTPVRVLTVNKGLGPGGAERLVVSLAATRDADAVEYEAAYLLPYKDHLVGELEALGVRTHLVGTNRGLAGGGWIPRLRRLAAEGGFDVVHVHSPAVGALAQPALRTVRPRPALVATEHNLWSSLATPTRWARRLTVRRDDAVIAVSEPVKASMGRDGRRAEVVVHGTTVAALAARRTERAEARAALGLEEHDVAVVTIANLRATKDYPNLLVAARRVLADHPQAAFLAIGQGPLLEDVQAEARELGLGDRFRFLGHRADVAPVLAAADVFTLASRHEGLPVALLEAIAVGLPAVVTDVGASGSVVRHGVDGLVVPPQDPVALAEALSALVVDPDRRRCMAASATARAEHFDISVAARRLEALYRRLRDERS